MKPFITDACKDGHCTLPLQLEGIARERLEDVLVGQCVVAYALPDGHSLECAWQFRLLFDRGTILEFSSASTIVTGWQEVGSLNIKNIAADRNIDEDVFNEIQVARFNVASVECLVYDAPEVYSECGIVLSDLSKDELIIAAGVSPGCVSTRASFSKEKFAPEFFIDDYRRVAL